MKDNRDPQELGNFLLYCREKEPMSDMGMSELYDDMIGGVAIRNYGETEFQFQHRVTMPPQTFAPPAGNST